ncbi:cell division protein FtsZ, partial [Bacillus cereus]
LSKGLVEEFNEFKERQSQIQYTKSQISTIESIDEDEDLGFAFGDFIDMGNDEDENSGINEDDELADFLDP